MGSKTPVGVDIGATAVRVAEVTDPDGDGYVTINRAAVVTLPAGAVVGGRIRDPLAVAGAIGLAARQTDLSGRPAAVGVSSTRSTVTQLAVAAGIGADDIDLVLRSTADQLAAASFEDVAVTAKLVETVRTNAGLRSHRIVVSTVPTAELTEVKDVIRLAGLTPVAADLAGAAVARSLLRHDPESPHVTLVVDIGEGLCSMLVVDGEHLRSLQTINGGGADVTSQVAHFLGSVPAAAEIQKRHLSINTAPKSRIVPRSTFDDTASTVDRIDHQTPGEEALAAAAAALVDRIDEYRHSEGINDMRVTQIVLTGGGARLRGLPELVEDRLRVPTRMGRPWAKLTKKVRDANPGRPDTELLDDLAVAVGLGAWRP